jgi:hypothetical protein
MPRDPLRRKLTVRAAGQTLVLVKRPEESGEHVVQKALLWAMYLPAFPTLRVEQRLPWPSRYKPDLYALDPTGQQATFWGECGVVGVDKLRDVLRRHPATRFAFSKWATRLDPFATAIDEALDGVRRSAPVELVGFPDDADRWLDAGRDLVVPAAGITVRRWGGAPDAARSRLR